MDQYRSIMTENRVKYPIDIAFLQDVRFFAIERTPGVEK